MWLGREVRCCTIFLSCALALWGGAIARGTGEASGLPSRNEGGFHTTSFVRSGSPDDSRLPDVLCFDDPTDPACRGVFAESIAAMSLYDGPDAVCLAGLGVVCVSLVKNRRLWMGLCLLMLSNGRLGAAYLSGMNVSPPESTGPESPTDRGFDYVLWHQQSCRIPERWMRWPVTALCRPEVLTPGRRNPLLSQDWACWDRGKKGLLSRVGWTHEGIRLVRPCPVGWEAVHGSVAVGCIEWARPPP